MRLVLALVLHSACDTSEYVDIIVEYKVRKVGSTILHLFASLPSLPLRPLEFLLEPRLENVKHIEAKDAIGVRSSAELLADLSSNYEQSRLVL